MKRLAGLLALSGCYIGAHGSSDVGYHMQPGAKSASEGAVDLGLIWSDDHQSGGVLMGMGASPLVGADPTTTPPRSTLALVGGRYERAFVASHPSVRWFGRFMFGGNSCGVSSDKSMPDKSCMTPEQQRDVGVVSTAVGVALTGSKQEKNGLMPNSASVGLAVVYTQATDAMLGTGDFIGLELSFGFGIDVLGILSEAGRGNH